jgi:tetratricopeptide (TPR) repeat protein
MINRLLDLTQEYQFKNPVLSGELVKRSAILAEKTENPLLISRVMNAGAIIDFYLGNNQKAVNSMNKSLGIIEKYQAENPDSTFVTGRLIAMYGNAGNIYQAMGEMDLSLDMLLKALKLSTVRMNNQPENPAYIKAHITTLNNAAVIYHHLKKTQDAEELLLEALALGRKLALPEPLLPTLNNIGLIRIDQQRYAEALGVYNEALGLGKQLSDSMGISGNYNNLGLIYEKLGNRRKALIFYLASLSITQRLGFSIGIANTCANTARLYSELNHPDSAMFFAAMGVEEALRSGSNTYLLKNYETLASIYEKTGEYNKAFEVFKKYTSLKDSVFTIEKNKQIEEMTARFETEKKESENLLLKKNIKIQQRTTLLLIISLAAIVCIALLPYYFYRLKNKALKQQSKINTQEHALHQLEKARLEDQLFAVQQINELQTEKLEQKNRELSARVLQAINKNDAIDKIVLEIERIKDDSPGVGHGCFEHIRQIASDNRNFDKDWVQFKLHFEEVNPGFFQTLMQKFPDLSQHELKLCAYYRINLGTNEIARILNITTSAVQKSRHRLRKKMNIPSDVDIAAFLAKV